MQLSIPPLLLLTMDGLPIHIFHTGGVMCVASALRVFLHRLIVFLILRGLLRILGRFLPAEGILGILRGIVNLVLSELVTRNCI